MRSTIPDIETLRREYALEDSDGDLGYTIHVETVRQLLGVYYELGRKHLAEQQLRELRGTERL